MRLAYSPDQSRDESGKWSSTGADLAKATAALKDLPAHADATLAAHGYRANPLNVVGSPSAKAAWTDKKDEIEGIFAGQSFGELLAHGAEETVAIDSLASYQTWTNAHSIEHHLATIDWLDRPAAVVVEHGGRDWIVDGNNRLSVLRAGGATRARVVRVRPKQMRAAYDPDQPRDETGKWTYKGTAEGVDVTTPVAQAVAAARTGRPLNVTLYRGVDPTDPGNRIPSQFAVGEYRSPFPEIAATYGEKVLEVETTLENPYVMDLGEKAYFQELKREFGTRDPGEITRKLLAKGHDALIVRNVPANRGDVSMRDSIEVVVFKKAPRIAGESYLLSRDPERWFQDPEPGEGGSLRAAVEEHPIVAAADSQIAALSVNVRYAFARAKKALRAGLGLDRALRDMEAALGETLPKALARAARKGGEAAAGELRVAGEWREEDHPRDEQGKFTTTFHGTTADVMESILKGGIQPGSDDPIAYTTVIFDQAETYAAHRARKEGKDPVVFELSVPTEDAMKMGRDVGTVVTTEKGFKAEWIKAVHTQHDSGELNFYTQKPKKVWRRRELSENELYLLGAHKFSSTQLDLLEPVRSQALAMAAKIDDADLAADSREQNPHITVKWGLHTNDATELRALLKNAPLVRVRLGGTSLFSSEEHDVVKIDIESEDLRLLNLLVSTLPNTQTHDGYVPHVTLAYVKPGLGAKYVGDMTLDGVELEFREVTFSNQDDDRFNVPLEGVAWQELRAAKRAVKPRVKLNIRFDAERKEAQAWAKRHAAELISDISETSRRKIRVIIAEFGDLNDAIDRIEALVFDADRAETIARTESMRAAHEGQKQLWRQAEEEGLLNKPKRTWITTPDDKLCPICEDLDGREAKLEGEYEPGIEGPPAHPNCRCTEGLA